MTGIQYPDTAQNLASGRLDRIRILHIIDSLIAGGKERQFLELLKGLKDRPDIECMAVILSPRIEYDGIRTSGINFEILARRTRYDLSIFPRLSRIIRSFNPDIVQSWNAMCSFYSAPIARMTGTKFVNGYIRSAPTRRSILTGSHSLLGKLTWPLSDAIVSNSEAGLGAFGVRSPKGITIRNGFDQDRLKHLAPPSEVRRELSIKTPHVVGMVGSFTPRKDYTTFFSAAERVLSVRDDVTFLTIGDGPELRAIGDRLSMRNDDRIRLLGRRLDVESIVNIFSIGVLTSNLEVHGEGISNSLMEYMALAKPAIATDCAGNRELIEEGTSGFLIRGKDGDALAERIGRLLDNAALASQMGDCGRRRIETEFSLERMIQDYVGLYRRLLKLPAP